jgi:hypothetical protein
MTLQEAKKAFIQQYALLFDGVKPGGINLVGIGVEGYIDVGVASSQEVMDQIPDMFQGWPVKKEIIGDIVPYSL